MKTKKVIKYFSIVQYKEEEEYLRSMHQSGWKLVKVYGFCVYLFEECEPMDVIYRLDYNKDGIEHKAEYVQMFNDCGWEYLQDYFGYSYFRKPASEENSDEDIFCDDESKLEMLSRVFKGRLIPILIVFLAVLIPQFAFGIYENRPLITIMYGALLALYIVVILQFAAEYGKHKRSMGK